jgi:23S rRNA pseudouridine2604 synthase
LSFRNKLKYVLVHKANFTNEKAQELINSGDIIVNGINVNQNILIEPEDEIALSKTILQKGIQHQYILFYKPRGIETTHNTAIENSFVNHFPVFKNLFFAGRLDKDSEGLLFLTTNGKLANNLAHPIHKKEKEYIVHVNMPLNPSFKTEMENGVEIMGQKTAPCTIELLSSQSFKIILQEGKNRQIRRMCYKLGYEVTELKRTKIAQFSLGQLQPGEWKSVEKHLLTQLTINKSLY